ncbi:MAG: NAD(P)H-hydrate dehydratase [Candidatus Magasanikbacteria bacterium RIFOXYB2_FULL_40_13]|uniref:ADP-dependent (S)-NAD(P)H-hydrate dehydratase n=2 Tax=Candidatus Magasanikiibacteriota TaxID=1752731 RepID=A0A1F6NFK0_9BACT|nr:MAG: NAD(P)H-hydrate dehydratase [Candidatus Magasanikbacteria bacterium RIFOXYA2_FULL_40_20]OGH82776.1 MAG: NAD(P)H-hydrate dehydratase [Candidatus Magasanikbacteria bacterium RIFOXYB1_FULL_40_15]OGH86960.1 MAG: NAD(P)H-hydrate dehydratase [Candidatus Magasanikbacteria bacterium RIFOXYB2_FULL_40_13]
MQLAGAEIFKKIRRYQPASRKGDNGVVLVIAGSNKYHGALLLSVEALSRIADMVFVHSVAGNLKIIKKLKSEIATFISVKDSELEETIKRADVVLMGPGLEESKKNSDLLKKILTGYKNKKVVLDATSLWQLNPEWLNENCIVTPHKKEFEKVFGAKPIPQNVLKMASKYHCVVLLKGQSDYISDGEEIYENKTGNEGMTKGGTGDALAGIVAGFYSGNDALTAALAGAYLNGRAGDNLYKRKNTFYSAEDLVEELGNTFAELIV